MYDEELANKVIDEIKMAYYPLLKDFYIRLKSEY